MAKILRRIEANNIRVFDVSNGYLLSGPSQLLFIRCSEFVTDKPPFRLISAAGRKKYILHTWVWKKTSYYETYNRRLFTTDSLRRREVCEKRRRRRRRNLGEFLGHNIRQWEYVLHVVNSTADVTVMCTGFSESEKRKRASEFLLRNII